MPYRSINGVQLHYEEAGEGTPLVLLHGFPLDCRMWDAQRAELSSIARVITPDLRGFGQSTPATAFTMESLADDVHSLLAELNALPCVLGGLSMGGYVALNYVRNYPADLRGLVLADTRAEADTAAGKEARQKMIDLVRALGSRAVADQMEPKMLAPETLQHRPAVVRQLRQIMESCPPKTIEYALAAMRDRRDCTEELPAITTPTLILVGDCDAITPAATAQSMHQKIRGSSLTLIQGAGHMSPLEQPTHVNRALQHFLKN